MPPRETCSAITRCSSGRSSISALRCARPGLSFFGFGFVGASAFGFLGLSSLGAFRPLPSRSRPAPLARFFLPSSRRRPSFFFPERPFFASWVVTPWNSVVDPSSSIRSSSGRPLRPFAGITAVTKIPSISKSASALHTSPTAAPLYSSAPSSVPLGCLAPAARQVQVPSSL